MAEGTAKMKVESRDTCLCQRIFLLIPPVSSANSYQVSPVLS